MFALDNQKYLVLPIRFVIKCWIYIILMTDTKKKK